MCSYRAHGNRPHGFRSSLVTILPPAEKPLVHIYSRHGKDCPYTATRDGALHLLEVGTVAENGKLRASRRSRGRGQVRKRFKDKIEAAFDAALAGQPVSNGPITVEHAVAMFTAEATKPRAPRLNIGRHWTASAISVTRIRYYINAVTESDMPKI